MMQTRDGLMRWAVSGEGEETYVTVSTPVETRYLVPDAPGTFQELEAVMIDMDGTSTDTEKLILEALRRTMAGELGDVGFAFSPEDCAYIIGNSNTNRMVYLTEKYGLSSGKLQEYIDNYHKKYHEMLVDIRDGKATDHSIEPMPGLKEFLLCLKERGVKVGLVTSNLGRIVDVVMAEAFRKMEITMPFCEFYDGVIVGEEVGEAFLKPHPNLYVRVAGEKLFIEDKSKCFVVEDSSVGVAAARIAGFAAAAIPCPGTDGQDFRLANLGVLEGGLPEIMAKNLFCTV